MKSELLTTLLNMLHINFISILFLTSFYQNIFLMQQNAHHCCMLQGGNQTQMFIIYLFHGLFNNISYVA
jgi:hypothetical protein